MYIQNRQSIKAAARATSCARSSVDLDKKWAASRTSYIADLDKRPHPPPPPPPHAHAGEGLPNADWSTNRNLYYTHPQTHSIPIPSTAHIYTHTHLLPLPKKTPKTSYRKSTLPKSAKTSNVGMDFHQKTFPQKPMKQATMHIAMRAQTIHTSQLNA